MRFFILLFFIGVSKLGFTQINEEKEGDIPTCCVAFAEVGPDYINGGEGGLKKFVEEHLDHSKITQHGKVRLAFVVDTTGNVRIPRVIWPLNAEADKEALRIVKLLKFKPATNKGQKVAVKFSLPIEF